MTLWAKLWTDILDDPKLMRAAREGAKHLAFLPWLIAFAKRSGDSGRISIANLAADPADIARSIPSATTRQIAQCLAECVAIGVLERDPDDVLRFVAWNRRSEDRPSNSRSAIAERVRRHRERAKALHGNTGNALHGVTDRVTSGPPTGTNGNAGNALRNATELEIEIEKERSEDLGKERGEDRNALQGVTSAPPASPLIRLKNVRAFVRTFYPRPDTSIQRRQEIVAQLEASLSPQGAKLARGAFVHAYSRERLDAKCAEVVSEGVKDRDKAIVVLLKKLGDTSDSPAPAQQAELRAPAERAAEERSSAEDLEHATAWLADNADVRETLELDVINALIDYGMPTVPDDELGPMELATRRIVRNNLVLMRWRAAGAPIVERAT